MSREHDVVTLSGAEYDALLSEAEEAARLMGVLKRIDRIAHKASLIDAERISDIRAILRREALTTGGDDARD